MAGGKATPKKDKALKVSSGQAVKTGEILLKRMNVYKAGRNVRGWNTLFALCPGRYILRVKRPAMGSSGHSSILSRLPRKRLKPNKYA